MAKLHCSQIQSKYTYSYNAYYGQMHRRHLLSERGRAIFIKSYDLLPDLKTLIYQMNHFTNIKYK